MMSLVDFFSQYRRTSKGDNPSLIQHHILACGRISTPSLGFVIDAELTESADQNVIAVFKGLFDNFEQGFDDFNAFFGWKSDGFVYGVNELSFCERHRRSSPVT
jgi:hypothetical protein